MTLITRAVSSLTPPLTRRSFIIGEGISFMIEGSYFIGETFVSGEGSSFVIGEGSFFAVEGSSFIDEASFVVYGSSVIIGVAVSSLTGQLLHWRGLRH